MKSGIFKFAAFATCIGLSESAVGNNDDGSGDLALGSVERPAPAKVAPILAWGEHTMIPNLARRTEFIRHTATEYQRRIAERNAKAFFSQLTPAKKVELRRQHVKAVLIPTARSPRTSPETKDVRMRFSLEGDLVDDGAYEFKSSLQASTIIKTDDHEDYAE